MCTLVCVEYDLGLALGLGCLWLVDLESSMGNGEGAVDMYTNSPLKELLQI
jgi:hypothetical protein